jgi:hypothetical protein
MPPFKDSFQDRVGQAAEAKRKALEKLRAKAPLDEAVVAARVEAARQREVRAEEKRLAKAEKAKAAEEARAADEAKAAAPVPTEAERKAATPATRPARTGNSGSGSPGPVSLSSLDDRGGLR